MAKSKVGSTTPSETCYNMAAVVEHAAETHQAGPAILYFAIADHAIPIHMNVIANSGQNGAIDVGATGRTGLSIQSNGGVVSSDIAVTAAIEAASGDVQRATFVEVTSFGSPAQAAQSHDVHAYEHSDSGQLVASYAACRRSGMRA